MNSSSRKGYSYHVTDEQLQKHSKLTTEQKLSWLEEANEFVNRFAPERTKRLHRMFRKGEI